MGQALSNLRAELRALASPKKAKASARFFKTAPGEYGQGDRFLGVTVPDQRAVARRYRDLPLNSILKLLRSPFHEHRLTAVFIMVSQYQRGSPAAQTRIAQTYLRFTRFINNWDIVDSSAPYILGPYLLDKPRHVLYRLVSSRNLWERRIAVLAAGFFIRHAQYVDTLKLAERLLTDPHDLIHKAVGWMLRVVGDYDRSVEIRFLQKHVGRMPRTMLRYAIEKFSPADRRRWLRA